MNSHAKENLVEGFEIMKSMEQSALNFYLNALEDPIVADETMRQAFRKIIEDEKKHLDFVQQIIDLIKKDGSGF